MDWYPLIVLAVGILVVLTSILVLRINAFIALIVAAIVVSMMAPGELAIKMTRVAEAFGKVAGAISITIAMAAVIGKCLMDSGAAERIVRAFTGLLGEKRTPIALTASGYLLSVPVFFDTVFYLLVPLARSLYLKTRKNYVLYTTAIVAGGAVTHSMVPPTPGPLFVANELKVDLGTMILTGALIAIPMSVVGLILCHYLNRRMPIPMPHADSIPEPEPLGDGNLPPLWISLLPVILPVILISSNTFAVALGGPVDQASAGWKNAISITAVLGNPNFALLLSGATALLLVAKWRGHSLTRLAEDTEVALMSAGIIILITAAGGAFGAMLREAGIQNAVRGIIGDAGSISGVGVLLAAFGIASLLKFAQGSSTVAMITTSSMFAAMGFNAELLGFHMVYLACSIGSGAMVGHWMNDSGFWVFSKMSGFTTVETLKTWSVLTAVLGCTGFAFTVLGALLVPLHVDEQTLLEMGGQPAVRSEMRSP